MFTGLISHIGKVKSIQSNGESAKLIIESPEIASEIKIGDSVAVNGVCLTVTEFDSQTFAVDVMVQTLNLTSTGKLQEADQVNLELATKSSDRLGGHIVQGHVDGVAEVSSISDGEKWQEFTATMPNHLMKYVVAQGSISVEGVSLTVGVVNDKTSEVTVWLIPATLEKTNLSTKKVGDLINIEVDVLAKYVERLMEKR